jgi:hypothetical protein
MDMKCFRRLIKFVESLWRTTLEREMGVAGVLRETLFSTNGRFSDNLLIDLYYFTITRKRIRR